MERLGGKTMPVIDIIRSRMNVTPNEVLTLRDGQIVRGKIAKLFPGNKAEVQIGSHRLIAEILTPLRAGDSYYFQVSHDKSKLIRLQVISESLVHNIRQSIEQLFQTLGMKVSRQTIQFAEHLMNERIPFDRAQLHEALQLLDRIGFTNENRAIITDMIARQLPLSETVFRALQTVQQEQLTPLLQRLVQSLQAQPTLSENEQQLVSLIDRLTNPNTNQQTFPPLFQQKYTPLISLLHGTNHSVRDATLFSEQQRTQLMSQITQFLQRETNIRQVTTSLLEQFPQLHETGAQRAPLVTLRTQIIEQLMPLLPTAMKQRLNDVLSLPQHLQQTTLYDVLQTLAQRETFTLANELLQEANVTTFRQLPIQSQFMSHLFETMQSLGLQHERMVTMLLNNQSQATEPYVDNIKSFLLQMGQETSVRATDQVTPLLQFVNGMQLQTVQENAHFLLASFVIPGEKLALNKDLYMQFEGQKKEDGKLDPDHCRILFVLHLERLKETIIDMQVQKRVISLTIYNDDTSIVNDSTTLQKELANNLEKLDYHLSNVKWKALHERVTSEKKETEQITNIHQEGFDFRV